MYKSTVTARGEIVETVHHIDAINAWMETMRQSELVHQMPINDDPRLVTYKEVDGEWQVMDDIRPKRDRKEAYFFITAAWAMFAGLISLAYLAQ